MTNSNTPPPPPALTLVERLYAVHNINNIVPVKLDIDEANYSSWSYFFTSHCNNFGVLKHIEGGETSTSVDYLTADSIVKTWIILTLAPALQSRVIKAKPKTAKDAWDLVEKIFLDNKRTRTVALKGELRVIQMGDLTADAYFRKIESIVTHLSDLGSSMPDEDIVTYAINGLSPKFANLATIIAHRDPFPNFDTMRSMVVTEEMRLHSQSLPSSTSTTSAAPHVLLAEASNPHTGPDSRLNNRDSRNTTRTEVCRNFGRGYCRWGSSCRYLHDSSRAGNSGSNGNVRSNSSQGNTKPNMSQNTMHNGLGQTGLNVAAQQQLLQLLQAQSNLLSQFGINCSTGQQQAIISSILGSRPNAPPGFPLAQSAMQGSNTQQAFNATTVHGSGQQSNLPGQETVLPQAFNAMTLQDPANWNMDTGLLDPSNSTQM